MKVLFIQHNPSAIGYRHISFIEPLAFETLAACLVPQHQVNFIDMRIDPNLEDFLDKFQPDIVGSTAYTADVFEAQKVLKRVKNYDQNIVTVIGGHHATLASQDFQKIYVDVIVKGEGELVFRELVDAYEEKASLEKVKGIIYRVDKKWFATSPPPLIKDIDKLPLPLRSLTKNYHKEYYWFSAKPVFWIETSRGCPYKCNFCSVWKFYNGKCRSKTPERVVEEIESINSEHIFFSDDNFFANITRAKKICDLIKSKQLKKKYFMQASADIIANNPDLIKEWAGIGLIDTAIGLESFKDSDLKDLNKRSSVSINEQALNVLKQNNVSVFGLFIVGLDYTEEDFDSLADYVEKLEISYCQFSILTPLPGTVLYEKTHEELLTHNYNSFDFMHVVLPTKLPKYEYEKRFVQLYKRSYLSPRNVLKKIIKTKPSISQLYTESKGINSMIKDLERQLKKD